DLLLELCDQPVALVERVGPGEHRLVREEAERQRLARGEVHQRREQGVRGARGVALRDGPCSIGAQALRKIAMGGHEARFLVLEQLIESCARDAGLAGDVSDLRLWIAV